MKRLWAGFQVSLVIHGALVLGLCALARHAPPEHRSRTIDLAILSTAPPGAGTGETQVAGAPAAGPGPAPTAGAGAMQPPVPAAPDITAAASPPQEPHGDGVDAEAPVEDIEHPAKPVPAPITEMAPPAAVAETTAGTPKPSPRQERAGASPGHGTVPPPGPAAAAAVAWGNAAAGASVRAAATARPEPGPGAGGGPTGPARAAGPVDYGAIHSRIASCLRYPKIARKRGWCGRVLVAFTLLPDGRVERPEIRESCGIALLDQSALKTVKDASPFPGQGGSLRIVVPVVFRLES